MFIHVDNMTALSYLLKMGETENPELLLILKEIWEFLLGNLPGNLQDRLGI